MGAYFDAHADTRRRTYNDPASGWLSYEEDVPGWFVYCDNCESFAVRPSGYKEVYHDYQAIAELPSSEKLKKLFWGNFYRPSTRMETRYANFCYRGFRCAECGTQFFIQREQLVRDPVWTDEKTRLRYKLWESRQRYDEAKDKYLAEFRRRDPTGYSRAETYSSYFDLQYREKTGAAHIRPYGEFELVSDPKSARRHW